jgi:hypothetical protein
MQFLEWSVLGLRSARHVLLNRERDVSVTLFPMVHIGEAEFYESVFADATAHEVVVIEGVKSRLSQRLTRSYRWLKPERLGLTVQPKFSRESVPTILADLPGEEFDRIWRGSHWLERTVFEWGSALVGIWLRLTGDRTSIGQRISTTDLPDRDMVLAWNHRRASMFEALIGARDTVLCSSVRALLAKQDGPRRIAVIYGAAHMGVLVHDLREMGFRPVSSDWMTIFSQHWVGLKQR